MLDDGSNNTTLLHQPLTPPLLTYASPARLRRVALIASFPPRRCGIATFTADVLAAIQNTGEDVDIEVIAIDDQHGACEYGDDVSLVVRQGVLEDYVKAGEWLNEHDIDVICVQHEFGIFGGDAGAHLLTLLAAAKAPVVTVFHTILREPNPAQQRVMTALLQRSSRAIAMSARAKNMLINTFGAERDKVDVIPHGAPDRPLQSIAEAKQALGLNGRKVLLTFGLLSPNKGLESMVRAMPKIVARHPDALYLVLGATHPHLLRQEGERYRQQLVDLAVDLGVEDHVRFVNTYVDTPLLLDYLAAADLYVTPYLHEQQITSGTLAYAVAMGKPVVSTPYWHAQDILANGVGVLVDFNDSDGFARSISKLLSDDKARAKHQNAAYKIGRTTIWPRAAEKYLTSFRQAMNTVAVPRRAAPRVEIRAPQLSALIRMSDDCGMFQHARFCVPDRNHGYCIDDNARALILVQRMRALHADQETLNRLEVIYAGFIDHAWNPDEGRFRNFKSYSRQWLEPVGSDDSNGRGLWCLGEVARHTQNREVRDWSLDLGTRAAVALADLKPLRARAFCLLSGVAALEVEPDNSAFRRLVEQGAQALSAALAKERRVDWVWFEPMLGYDNARLPQALMLAGAKLKDKALIAQGLQTLEWLSALQRSPFGHFRPVGHESFGRPHELPEPFDQQPLEAAATIDACWLAYELTEDSRWIVEAERAYAWFAGENDLFTPLETEGGGCFDGLGRGGPNRNQGAESILALQISHCEMALHRQKLAAR